ncbi:MAG: glucosamine-6-phosphate deaminase, partial [Xanthomonadales bacterium]|nr:glucosamine-6-phosphate deaminase [Gammaproteobacteria bacterium]NNL05096.1 glucosamine-6-phosphate deaminase [Xanthomonadales bacterium]
VARHGAGLVEAMLGAKPAAVLGFATGGTPIALYRELIARHRAGAASFEQVTSFNLDEYLGVAPDDPQSYRAYMDREFFDHVDIDRAKTHLPACPAGENPQNVGLRYEALIRDAGGVDLQILGIGQNGHIGFNEPSSSLASRTRVKTLTPRTLEDNSRLFEPGEVQPRLAITMGIGTIMDARRILLLATGESKAGAVARMVEGPVSAMCPASVLQLHETVTVLIDEAAAAQLQNREYYERANRENRALKERFGEFYAER